MPQRRFSPYELTQLARAGINPTKFHDADTTPVEYITGRVTFCDSEFMCTPDTLIPRIETEELVDYICTHIEEKFGTEPASLLDVGTGTGAIGISVARRFPAHQITVMLTDISPAALDVARQNRAALLSKDYSIQFIHSNVLENIPAGETFDIISANLPYVTSSEMTTLPDSVRNHEPHLALDGGQNGTELFHQLLTTVMPFTHQDTTLFFEINEIHTVDDILRTEHAAQWSATQLQDSFGKVRFLVLSRK